MTVLDTDTYTLLRMGHSGVGGRLRHSIEPVAITVITRIEVLQSRFASVLKAADGAQLRQAIQRLARSEQEIGGFDVLTVDDAASAEFDDLRRHTKLKKIGRADLLIASIALANQATLVTRNLRDFRLVPGLRVENWAD